MGRVKNVKKYNYFYKITNNLNNHFYYGIHSTDNLEDGYMGSGTRLNYAYKKYGIENFTKEILKFFDTREECAEYEAEMVTEELIHNNECYNIVFGGEKFNSTQTITVKDENNNYSLVSIFDKRYINGKLKPLHYNEVLVKEKNGNNDYHYIPKEKYYQNKNLYETKFHNKVLVKDNYNKYFYVNKNDERYISGTLTPFWSGKKHKKETIEKVKNTFKEIKHQQGEKNSQYGTCWVMKDNENKKIKKEELDTYIQMGWIKGRKIKKSS